MLFSRTVQALLTADNHPRCWPQYTRRCDETRNDTYHQLKITNDRRSMTINPPRRTPLLKPPAEPASNQTQDHKTKRHHNNRIPVELPTLRRYTPYQYKPLPYPIAATQSVLGKIFCIAVSSDRPTLGNTFIYRFVFGI